jgi:hypothetical protein
VQEETKLRGQMKTWDQFLTEQEGFDEGWLSDMWNSRIGMTPEQAKAHQEKKVAQKAQKQMNAQIAQIIKKYKMVSNRTEAYNQTVACAQEITQAVPGSDYQKAMNQCAAQIGLKIN